MDEKKTQGAGSLWTWTALDADSKLIVSYLCGGRDASWGKAFMEDVASRLPSRVQITTKVAITRAMHSLRLCRFPIGPKLYGGEWGIRTPDRTFGPITV